MKRSVSVLKNYFKTGDKPTQQQFYDFLESFVHLDGIILASQVQGLEAVILKLQAFGISDVIGLQTALNNLNNAITTLEIADISGLQDVLSALDIVNIGDVAGLQSILNGLATRGISDITGLSDALNLKVTGVTGYGLSKNDFSDTYVNIISTIQTAITALTYESIVIEPSALKTLALTDAPRKRIIFTGPTANSLVVPLDLAVAWYAGTRINGTVKGNGAVTISGAGITFIGNNLTFPKGESFSLINIGLNEWAVEGNAPASAGGGTVTTVGTITLEQLAKSSVWNLTHNLANPFPSITVYDINGNAIIPKNITKTDSNSLVVSFPLPIQGYATLSAGAFTPSAVPAFTYEIEVQNYINLTTGLSEAYKIALNNFVIEAKAYQIWNKLLYFNPRPGTTEAQNKFNLKDARDLNVAYRVVYTGTWIHSALGAKSNATDTFANTFLNPSTLGLTGNISMGTYCTEPPTGSGDVYLMGGHSGANNFFALQKGTTNGLTALAYGADAVNRTFTNNARGMYAISVNGATKTSFYNDSLLETVAVTGSGVPNVPIYEGALNLNGRYGSLAFGAGSSFIGTGLTVLEMNRLYEIILNLETAFSRY